MSQKHRKKYIAKECRKMKIITIRNSTKNYIKNVVVGH